MIGGNPFGIDTKQAKKDKVEYKILLALFAVNTFINSLLLIWLTCK
jgi:hypothetical protein